MNKLINLGIVFISLLNSCSPPSIDNVKISTNYTMNYDYYAYDFGGVDYDAYWPSLEIHNSSNANANIAFKYSFYVCGYRQTASSLNKTITTFAPKGFSYWEMNVDDTMVIPSDEKCGTDYVNVNDVDFDWTVLSVYQVN